VFVGNAQEDQDCVANHLRVEGRVDGNMLQRKLAASGVQGTSVEKVFERLKHVHGEHLQQCSNILSPLIGLHHSASSSLYVGVLKDNNG
jgi:hypothetical protein